MDNKHNTTTCTGIPNLQTTTKYTQTDNLTMAKIQNYNKISKTIKHNNNTNTPTATLPTCINHKRANLVETDHESEQQQQLSNKTETTLQIIQQQHTLIIPYNATTTQAINTENNITKIPPANTIQMTKLNT